jgi:glycyl-tRNA synthetase beta chain
VAKAIHEHYLPTQAGGDLPTGDAGALVSIADKLDTICGCFGVGLIPTGTADPYALRRSALGIIHIILERRYPLSLAALVERSLELLAAKLTRPRPEVTADVLEFFRGRFFNLLAGRYPVDVVDAVTAVSCDDLGEAAAKIAALADFKNRPDFEPLAGAFKRVVNIVKEPVTTPVNEALLVEGAERELLRASRAVANTVVRKVAERDYLAALTEIALLKPAVDAFFDAVMVMAEDPAVRANRLALLQEIKGLFRDIADFGRVAA